MRSLVIPALRRLLGIHLLLIVGSSTALLDNIGTVRNDSGDSDVDSDWAAHVHFVQKAAFRTTSTLATAIQRKWAHMTRHDIYFD